MRLLTRSFSLLVVVAALALAASATASAATSAISSPGAKGGTGTTAVKLVVQGSGSTATVSCTGTGLYVKLVNASGPLPLTLATNYQPTFTGCTTASAATTLTCTATGALKATALSVGGVTPMSLSSLNCTASISGCGTAKLTGSVPGSFGPSQLTVPIAGQALTVSGSTCARIPNGKATVSNPTGGAMVYWVLPAVAIGIY
jgi:hypothetical protein